MKILLRCIFLVLPFTLLMLPLTGRATPIEASYSIDLNTNDPGLKLHEADVAPNPFMLNLNPGQSVHGPLFRIWTDEVAINEDDEVSKPIAANFNFTLPQVFDGSVTGETVGGVVCFILCGEYGQVSWNGPVDLFFGPKDDGHLQISLDDAIFNTGLFGINSGEEHGATVYGDIKLIADATAVPEPGLLAMFGLGLLWIGLLRRKMHK